MIYIIYKDCSRMRRSQNTVGAHLEDLQQCIRVGWFARRYPNVICQFSSLSTKVANNDALATQCVVNINGRSAQNFTKNEIGI